MNKRLLFIVNVDWFFMSHRLPIAREALNHGYEVHIATSLTNSNLDKLHSYGLVVHPLEIARSNIGLLGEVKTFLQILNICKRLRPQVVHLVTIKPVILGGIVARLLRVPAMVAAISGLGTAFATGKNKKTILRLSVQKLYQFALGHFNSVVIFQNPEDRDDFLKFKAIRCEQVRLIRGSGVDLNEYKFHPEPLGRVVVTMAARLLKDKGVFEYAEAAKLLHSRGIPVEFRLIGAVDNDNPTSLSVAELETLVQEGQIKYLGYREDIPVQYAASNIVCLPSYYREGLPKSLIEAAACGRAVVTTDMPGCRDAIEPGVTGLLVPPQNAVALADAIQRLIENPDLRNKMGTSGRELAEKYFCIKKIVAQHLALYDELVSSS